MSRELKKIFLAGSTEVELYFLCTFLRQSMFRTPSQQNAAREIVVMVNSLHAKLAKLYRRRKWINRSR